MTGITTEVTIADVMAKLEVIEGNIKELTRKVEDFRSSYDHHAAQEARVHAEIREDIGSSSVRLAGGIAEFNQGIKELSTAIVRIDTRVGILESA